jgi:hypothetical protein
VPVVFCILSVLENSIVALTARSGGARDPGLGLCEAISTIRAESLTCWSGKMNATARSKEACLGWEWNRFSDRSNVVISVS